MAKKPISGEHAPGVEHGDPTLQRLRRRTFIKQAAVIGGASAVAGWAALAPADWPLSLRDPDGERGKPREPLVRLPQGGFAVPPKPGAAALGIARGQQIDKMVRSAVDSIGGIGHYIRSGDVVVLKPNVAFERPAILGATTNPEVLTSLIRLVKEAGAREVRVVDNPIESPQSCFRKSGIERAAVEAGARVYLPSPGEFATLQVPGAKHIARWPFFWRPFADADKVIGVAPVKDHNLCRASMTTKNWYGLLGGRRNQFHQDIHGIITDLALMLKPTFVVLDASRVLFRSGPTGGSLADVRPGHCIAAATDSLALDAFGWDELLRRQDKPKPGYFEQAAAKKLGEPRWRSLSRKDVNIG
ncbi:MAG: DUF362 domain-containing protein [Deltaproteobacteria bacterium]|nr:DUF362 domain-containing protein [Deltaproteobacteria bacterium]